MLKIAPPYFAVLLLKIELSILGEEELLLYIAPPSSNGLLQSVNVQFLIVGEQPSLYIAAPPELFVIVKPSNTAALVRLVPSG